MLNRTKALLLTALGMSLFTAGCGISGGSGAEGNSPAPSHSDITILPNPENTSYGTTTVEPLVRIEGVRGSEWLSDDLLVVSKENPDGQPVTVEGTEYRPLNLYAHTVSTGEEEALSPGPENQGYALANPGRRLIFYKTFDWQSNTGTGYVMDLQTRKSVRITEKDELELTNGVWLDERTILYSSMDGRLISVSADGMDRKQWPDPKASMLGNLSAQGGKIYYTTPPGLLLASDIGSGERNVVGKNVVWAAPSAAGEKLGIVNRIKSGTMELYVTDADGGNRRSIAQDNQIFGVAWNEAGDRLAYSAIEPSGTTKGVYVADPLAGTSVTLPIDIKYIADAPRWSPSGDRLMITDTLIGNDRSKPAFVTYLAAAQ
ncbi:hypothetical protein E5161_09960 [Cohnella pontilimi]|uniref:TolB protein n=1 Tax=Cohnella pontilimi TaxID=2564100 RepID=A0A4U0FBZ9_9BACL|nr:hypothetical protein [Cohnella pontilimi]TJY42315.1 hypothetical protein E5161_09960 [Cohnella pontilimi]